MCITKQNQLQTLVQELYGPSVCVLVLTTNDEDNFDNLCELAQGLEDLVNGQTIHSATNLYK